MKYAELKLNDVANAPGIAVSFYTQGCPHHCKGCFNPETWSFDGGKEFTTEVLDKLVSGLTENGVHRSLCILGGEPLCEQNEFLTQLVITTVKQKVPDTPIYIWTGYTLEELLKKGGRTKQILEMTDYLIDGPFMEDLKDLSLQMRGSSNQRIFNLHSLDWAKKI